MQADPDKINAVIMGIVLMRIKSKHFDEEIQHIATSLAIESGKPIVRAELMQQIYLQLEKLMKSIYKMVSLSLKFFGKVTL